MSRAKYQLLPTSDRTPALDVNLSAIDSSNANHYLQQQSTAAAIPVVQAMLTEVNLNESTSVAAVSSNTIDEAASIAIIPADTAASAAATAATAASAPTIIPADEQSSQQQPAPPACELPSYNEALRLKKLECSDIPPSYYSSIGAVDTRIPLDPAIDLRAIAEIHDSPISDQDIGSECMFLSAFMIAFFFNWIGFFASICLLPNAAGKYGALSGFGLSMAKWVTIVRYQEWVSNMNDFQQKIFFWLFIFLGFYLFFRGLINYMTLKYRPRASTDYSNRMRNRWFWIIE